MSNLKHDVERAERLIMVICTLGATAALVYAGLVLNGFQCKQQ